MDWLIKGAHVVSPAEDLDGQYDLLVLDGRVAAIGHNIERDGVSVVDASDQLLMPGLVDLHTGIYEPGAPERETVRTGGRAAARGGYTTVVMMPATEPALDNVPALKQALASGKQDSAVRLLAAGALSLALAGEAMPEYVALAQAGACCFVQPAGAIANPALFRRMLQYSNGFTSFVAVQPHDASLSLGQMHEGLASIEYGLAGSPAVAEEVAVARDLLIAAEVKAPLHFYRISAAQSVAMIAQAKAAGVPISCDVSPYHLAFTDRALEDFNPAFKLQPPLRSEDHQEALIEALLTGTIDCVATHHTPWNAEREDVEFVHAPWGAVALETTLPLLYTSLVAPGRLGLTRLVEVLSTKPAQLLGLTDGPGSLRPGVPADFILVDPKQQIKVTSEDSLSLGRNNPLLGQDLRGWPTATFVNGSLVWGSVKSA